MLIKGLCKFLKSKKCRFILTILPLVIFLLVWGIPLCYKLPIITTKDALFSIFPGITTLLGIILAVIAIAHDRLQSQQFEFIRIMDLLKVYWKDETKNPWADSEIHPYIWQLLRTAILGLVLFGTLTTLLVLYFMSTDVQVSPFLATQNIFLAWLFTLIIPLSITTVFYVLFTSLLVIIDFEYSLRNSSIIGNIQFFNALTEDLFSREEQHQMIQKVRDFGRNTMIDLDDIRKQGLFPVFILLQALCRDYSFYKRIPQEIPETLEAMALVEIIIYQKEIKGIDSGNYYNLLTEKLSATWFPQAEQIVRDGKKLSEIILEYLSGVFTIEFYPPIFYFNNYQWFDKKQEAHYLMELLIKCANKILKQKNELIVEDFIQTVFDTTLRYGITRENTKGFQLLVVLIRNITNNKPRNFNQAIQCLGFKGEDYYIEGLKSIVDALQEIVKEEPDNVLKNALCAHLNFPDESIIYQVLLLTLKIYSDNNQDVNVLYVFARDPDIIVRKTVAIAIVELYKNFHIDKNKCEDFCKILEELLKDSCEEVRRFVEYKLTYARFEESLKIDVIRKMQIAKGKSHYELDVEALFPEDIYSLKVSPS